VSFLQVEGTETEDSLNRAVSEVSETEEQPELFDSTADDTSDTHHEQVSEVENVTYLHKESVSDTKDTSDSNTHQTVSVDRGGRTVRTGASSKPEVES
jgi:hypothetical protein